MENIELKNQDQKNKKPRPISNISMKYSEAITSKRMSEKFENAYE